MKMRTIILVCILSLSIANCYCQENPKQYDFSLMDTDGNIINLKDKAGTYTLILFAESWCGGCQASCFKQTDLYSEYNKYGIEFITIIPETPIEQLINYKEHCKNSFPIIMAEDSIRNYFGLEEWSPQYVILNSNRNIISKGIVVDESTEVYLDSLIQSINNIKNCSNGICKLPDYKVKPIEKEAKILFGNGKYYVLFTSNENGNNDIFLNVYNDSLRLLKKISITKSLGDDCCPDFVLDSQNQLWIIWLSNKTGHYHLYEKTYNIENENWSSENQITYNYKTKRKNKSLGGEYIEDVSLPDIAIDNQNTVWVIYSRWNTFYTKENYPFSKDCEIYANYYKNGTWANEFQVSSTNTKINERWDDHYSPKIISSTDNKMFVGWVCDLHDIYKKNKDLLSYSPSVLYSFIQGPENKVVPQLLGEVNKKRVEFPIPEYNVDILMDNSNIIHAIWLQKTKSIIYNKIQDGKKGFPILIANTDENFTSPVLIERENEVIALYAKNSDKEGEIYSVNLTDNSSEPELIKKIDSKIEYLNGIFNDNGELILVYTEYNNNECKIRINTAANK